MKEKTAPVTINARKFDGRIHRTWKAELIEKQGDLLVFVGEFEHEVSHPDLGVIRRGTVSYEYYWLEQWYNVFRFHEPDGALRNYYCNVNMPPRFDGSVLDYVDLDLDILVAPDFSRRLLDDDEFLQNSTHFSYPADVIDRARGALRDLSNMITARSFPFSLPEITK